jgi:hypothetical protein
LEKSFRATRTVYHFNGFRNLLQVDTRSTLPHKSDSSEEKRIPEHDLEDQGKVDENDEEDDSQFGGRRSNTQAEWSNGASNSALESYSARVQQSPQSRNPELVKLRMKR